jgi:hypothetical protein
MKINGVNNNVNIEMKARNNENINESVMKSMAMAISKMAYQ